MEQLLVQLTRRAHGEQVVVSQVLENGARLLVYPLEEGLMVGYGFDQDAAHHVQPETLVQKRSMQLSRFGAWLPAMFADGSCYVIRRIDYFSAASEVPVLSNEDLMAAQELMS